MPSCKSGLSMTARAVIVQSV